MKESAVFDALAPLLRVRPELQTICRFGAQWTSPHMPEPEGWAPFHIVTYGTCLLELPDAKPLTLAAGDIAILPHGSPHNVKSLSPSNAAQPIRAIPRAFDEIVIKTNTETTPETGLICGRFRFEQANHNTVLAALPSVVIVSGSASPDARHISASITLMRIELEQERIGAATVATALALAVMVIILRSHLESASPRQGVLALLAGRQTSKALLGMLNNPAYPWTLDDLAETAATSRATLVRQFQAAVQMPPVAYLAELRLTLARSRIRASSTPLAIIAEEIGYQSETAFTRAYNRQFGIPPSGDRAV